MATLVSVVLALTMLWDLFVAFSSKASSSLWYAYFNVVFSLAVLLIRQPALIALSRTQRGAIIASLVVTVTVLGTATILNRLF